MKNKPKMAVVLSGCGNKDGAEIHESVCTLLAIDKNGAEYECFAPNIPQTAVVNYITGDNMDEARNVLVEAARIARGDIRDLSEFRADDFDALILPGGFGAVTNLSSFASEGPAGVVNRDVEAAVKSMRAADKPLGALCIAPVILAKLVEGAEVTIGNDAKVAEAITSMNAVHKESGAADVVIDSERKLATTPCYMYDSSISQIAEAADKLVREVLKMINR